MTGVAVNSFAVIIGSFLGLVFHSRISKKVTDGVMKALGFCTLYIGIVGTLDGENTMILIISMVLGTIVGTAADIDDKLNRLGNFAERKFQSRKSAGTSVSEGFVTASLLFCVGSMAIVGGLNSGLRGDNTMLYTKSVMDFISSAMLSAGLGIGVMLASAAVFVYQGAIVLMAHLISPLLTEQIIAELNCAGSLMIVALGFNLIGTGKFKVANFLPALVFVPFVCMVAERLGV